MDNNTGNAPVLLGATLIGKATTDPHFYSVMPEFLPIKVRLDAMHEDVFTNKGCSSCKKRRIANTVNSDFMSITRSLSDSGATRLKKYFGVDRLIVNYVEPGSFSVKTKEI